MAINEVLKFLGESTARYIFSKDPQKDGSGINCISDIRPNMLYRAAVIWNFVCVEKAEIVNGKLILYARDPMLLIGSPYISQELWDFVQKEIKDRYDLLLAIGKFDDDWTAPIDPNIYTLTAWSQLGPHLKNLQELFGKEGYREEVERIFGKA